MMRAALALSAALAGCTHTYVPPESGAVQPEAQRAAIVICVFASCRDVIRRVCVPDPAPPTN